MLADGTSSGHYICDIQEENIKTWFRTNDNAEPLPIQVEDVSKQEYVVLYKLKSSFNV